jgi:hypothetical protein
MRRPRLALVVAVAVLALVGAGCGDGEEDISVEQVPSGDVGVTAKTGPSSSDQAGRQGPGVGGRVIAAPDGKPVEGAVVTPSSFDDPDRPQTLEASVTDANGEYFWPLDQGRWEITVEAPGFRPASKEVTVPNGPPARLDFVLQPVS